jgi:anoctamin-10
MFSIEFGQQDCENTFAVRPAFEGRFVRSIETDNLNEEVTSLTVQKLKLLFSLLISTILIICVIACVIGIFFFRK